MINSFTPSLSAAVYFLVELFIFYFTSLVYTVETFSMSDCVCQWRQIDGFFGITRGTLIFCETLGLDFSCLKLLLDDRMEIRGLHSYI
jgi:hypothetical protein